MIGKVAYEFLFVVLNDYGQGSLGLGLSTGRFAVTSRTQAATRSDTAGAAD